jgi:hypothetical protein
MRVQIFVLSIAVSWAISAFTPQLRSGEPQTEEPQIQLPRVEEPKLAGLATVYYQNSHADLILGRMLEGYSLDDQGEYPKLKLASLYVAQYPDNDKSRVLAAKHSVPIFPNARQALVNQSDRLAVDGVMLIAEHGVYPESDTGQLIYPKRQLFADVADVCEKSQRRVPVFVDKHLADNWQDAKWMYDEAKRLKIPMMAGSSLPVLWRSPAVDVDRAKPLKEIFALSYHRLDAYGFHALEMVQCLAERRPGGETGVKQVRTLRDDAVWQAIDEGLIDRELIDQAMSRYKDRPISRDKPLRDLVPHPVLFVVDYSDGLRASVLTVGNLYIDWSVAWRYADGQSESTVFWTQEARPFTHFAILVKQLEPFFQTGKPTWPVERTLLTTGLLDALLISHRDGGKLIETPQLKFAYQSTWNWTKPQAPFPDRPLAGP